MQPKEAARALNWPTKTGIKPEPRTVTLFEAKQDDRCPSEPAVMGLQFGAQELPQSPFKRADTSGSVYPSGTPIAELAKLTNFELGR